MGSRSPSQEPALREEGVEEDGEAHTDGATKDTSAPPIAPCPEDRTDRTPAEHRRNRKAWSEEEKREFWRRKKAEKKLRKKEKAAARQEALKAEWDALPENERQRRKEEAVAVHEKRRALEERLLERCEQRLQNAHTPVLVFDLSFAWCMTPADTKSTVSQIKFSYSTLRSLGFPFRPVITSLAGKEVADAEHDATVQANLLTALRGYEGFARFPPQIAATAHWSELFPLESTVFLTADAEDVLEDITDDTVYVVGAFVDHNQHKGLSRAAAERHGVRMAKLPIKESIELGNRCLVLTINHVVNVLAQYVVSKETSSHDGGPSGRGDWKSVLEKALPVRRVQQEVLGSRKRRRQAVNAAHSHSQTVSDRVSSASDEESLCDTEDDRGG